MSDAGVVVAWAGLQDCRDIKKLVTALIQHMTDTERKLTGGLEFKAALDGSFCRLTSHCYALIQLSQTHPIIQGYYSDNALVWHCSGFVFSSSPAAASPPSLRAPSGGCSGASWLSSG